MSATYDKSFDAGAKEHAVVSACYELHWATMDKDIFRELNNPMSIKELKKAREQLDSIIRKLEFKALAIDGVRVEARQVERASA